MLITLGDLSIDTFRRVKPLLVLTYLALEGQTTRQDLRTLLWPHAKQPDTSLRVVLHQLKQAGFITLVGDESPVCAVSCDAVQLLSLRGAQALSAYTGAFLHSIPLSEVSPEFEEWVENQRVRLARYVVEEALRLAESSPPETATQLLERAYRLPGAPSHPPEVIQRMLHMTLPGSVLETELRAELLSLIGPAEPFSPSGRPLRRMLGRSTELDTLLAWTAEPNSWIALVSGPGGIGKSILLRELLRELVLLNVRAMLIDAEGALNAGDLLPRLASACAPGQPVQGTWSGLAPLLGPQPILLLDGVDDLVDLPDLLLTLRAELPKARWVLTGRRRLGRVDRELLSAGQSILAEDVLILPLGGLDLPSPMAGLPEIAASSAVALFLQGARRVQRDFQLDSSNAARISSLTRRLLGHPLALTLAASWLRVESLADVYARVLKEALTLSSPEGDSDGHRGLMLIAQRSWDLLGTAEQQAALRLAVASDFDPADAEALGVSGEQLDALLAHSFLETYQPGSERLRIYPALSGLLKVQAHNHSALMEKAYAQHADHYLRWFMAQTPEAPVVDAERGNLRRAFSTAVATGALEAPAVDRWLVHYDRRGLHSSGTDVFAALSDEAERAGALEAVQAACQVACMWLALQSGRLLDAQTLATMFLQGPLAGDIVSQMKALNTLASVRSMQGEWRVATELFRQAATLAQRTQDPMREVMYRTNLLANLLYWEQGTSAEQEIAALEALFPILPEPRRWHVRQRILSSRTHRPEADLPALQAEARAVLEAGQQTGDTTLVMVGLLEGSRIHLRRGQLHEAALSMEGLKSVLKSVQNREIEIDLAILEIRWLYAKGRAPLARQQAARTLRLMNQRHNPWEVTEFFLSVAPDLNMRTASELQGYLTAVFHADQTTISQRKLAEALLDSIGPETTRLDMAELYDWLQGMFRTA